MTCNDIINIIIIIAMISSTVTTCECGRSTVNNSKLQELVNNFQKLVITLKVQEVIQLTERA